MIVRKTGYIESRNVHVVRKLGYVAKEEHSVISLEALLARGYTHYWVMSEPNACEACTEQSGYYRLEDGITCQAPRPPFHPNCKCTVQGNRLEPQQYNPATGAERPTYDPWAQEQNVWQFIAGSQESIEEQARRIIEFDDWTGLSAELIQRLLTAIEEVHD